MDLTSHRHHNYKHNENGIRITMIPSSNPPNTAHLTASGPVNNVNPQSPFKGAMSIPALRLVAGAVGGPATGPQTVHSQQQQQGI
jgi:hypothetical protein